MTGRGGFLHADDDVLRGMALALRTVDKDARKEWARSMRTTGTRVFASAVRKRSVLAQDDLFGRAAIRWSQTGKGTATVALTPLSGGLGQPGTREWAYVDFGSRQRRNGLPRYQRTGRVVYGALDPLGKWLGAMALRTTADLIRQAGDTS